MNSRQVHRPNRAGCVSNQTGNVSGCLTRQVQMSRALIHKTGSLLGLRGSGASVRGTPHVAPDTDDEAPAAAWGQWAQHSISGITRAELRMAESTSVGSLPQFPLIVFQARTGNGKDRVSQTEPTQLPAGWLSCSDELVFYHSPWELASFLGCG